MILNYSAKQMLSETQIHDMYNIRKISETCQPKCSKETNSNEDTEMTADRGGIIEGKLEGKGAGTTRTSKEGNNGMSGLKTRTNNKGKKTEGGQGSRRSPMTTTTMMNSGKSRVNRTGINLKGEMTREVREEIKKPNLRFELRTLVIRRNHGILGTLIRALTSGSD